MKLCYVINNHKNYYWLKERTYRLLNNTRANMLSRQKMIKIIKDISYDDIGAMMRLWQYEGVPNEIANIFLNEKEKPTSDYLIDDYIMINLIYCTDTHSFTHRLFEVWKSKFPESKNDAQIDAWQVIKEMQSDSKKVTR
jgi:hypothetical protein